VTFPYAFMSLALPAAYKRCPPLQWIKCSLFDQFCTAMDEIAWTSVNATSPVWLYRGTLKYVTWRHRVTHRTQVPRKSQACPCHPPVSQDNSPCATKTTNSGIQQNKTTARRSPLMLVHATISLQQSRTWPTNFTDLLGLLYCRDSHETATSVHPTKFLHSICIVLAGLVLLQTPITRGALTVASRQTSARRETPHRAHVHRTPHASQPVGTRTRRRCHRSVNTLVNDAPSLTVNHWPT